MTITNRAPNKTAPAPVVGAPVNTAKVAAANAIASGNGATEMKKAIEFAPKVVSEETGGSSILRHYWIFKFYVFCGWFTCFALITTYLTTPRGRNSKR